MVKVLRDHAAPAKRLIRRGDALALSKSAEKRLRMLATEARAKQMELADSVHLLLALLTTKPTMRIPVSRRSPASASPTTASEGQGAGCAIDRTFHPFIDARTDADDQPDRPRADHDS